VLVFSTTGSCTTLSTVLAILQSNHSICEQLDTVAFTILLADYLPIREISNKPNSRLYCSHMFTKGHAHSSATGGVLSISNQGQCEK